ncbi:MAG: AI-2E family transporter [Gemmatimonadota bacterium]
MRLKNLESRVFIGLVLATSLLFFWLVRDFLFPVFWAAVLAVLFRPIFERYARLLGGRPTLAALFGTITVVFAVLVPFALLVMAVTQQAISVYQQISTGELDLNAPIDFMERQVPLITDLMERYGIDTDQARTSVENAAVAAGQYVGGQAVNIGQNALTVTVMFLLMLYFLFFFLRDGDRITHAIVRAVPMGDERERRLLGKFAEVSRATVKGTLIVAMVQGALGGIMFAVVGIEAAVFWGVVMGVLSLLPAVGAFLIWVPAAIGFFISGVFWKGIFLVVAGTLVVGLVDNLLRPILVGRETKMPDYLVLLATLGGLTVFGLSGFVAGPIIAALFLVVWEMFAEEYAPLDSSEPPAVPTGGANVTVPADSALTAAEPDRGAQT